MGTVMPKASPRAANNRAVAVSKRHLHLEHGNAERRDSFREGKTML